MFEDYVVWVGGFSERVNDECILVIWVNGMVDFFDVDDDIFILIGD